MNVLVVLLHRRPGALDRVVGLLRRHGCALITLRFGPSDAANVDRAHVTFAGSSGPRIAQQLSRLVDVISADDMTRSTTAADTEPLPFHAQADGMSDGKLQET